ncbi:aspartyl protease family protein [Candidatus Peregrinibacteria bacterium]|nr:aspartyl protease family protein [Candidatus Peregrinibacteria bacterium]
MRFDFYPYEGNWLPIIPVIFACKKNRLPPILALVDTGATHTILPMEIATELGITIDHDDRIETQVAGGTQCFIYPSPFMIDCLIRDPGASMECHWRAPVFFSEGQHIVLLGHHRCLEKFDATFYGPEKRMELHPRFRDR